MEFPFWLSIVVAIFVLACIAAIVTLFVLRSKDNSSNKPLQGAQGPVGEIGFNGERGPTGFQGAIIGAQQAFPNYQLVHLGQVTVNAMINSPPTGVFAPASPNIIVTFEILSERISNSVVRRSVTLKATNIEIVPRTVGSQTTLQEFGFQFVLPTSVAGSSIVQNYNPYIGTAISKIGNQKAPPAILNDVTVIGSASNGISFFLTYSTGGYVTNSFIGLNQVLRCNFQITFLHDDNISA